MQFLGTQTCLQMIVFFGQMSLCSKHMRGLRLLQRRLGTTRSANQRQNSEFSKPVFSIIAKAHVCMKKKSLFSGKVADTIFPVGFYKSVSQNTLFGSAI